MNYFTYTQAQLKAVDSIDLFDFLERHFSNEIIHVNENWIELKADPYVYVERGAARYYNTLSKKSGNTLDVLKRFFDFHYLTAMEFLFSPEYATKKTEAQRLRSRWKNFPRDNENVTENEAQTNDTEVLA